MKTITNELEPREAQWQPNQSAELPFVQTNPTGDRIYLNGNNAVLFTNTTTNSYSVIPMQSIQPKRPQTVAELQVVNSIPGSAGQNTIVLNLRKASGALSATLSVSSNQFFHVRYFGVLDRYVYSTGLTLTS
jgi:hypothetical protein